MPEAEATLEATTASTTGSRREDLLSRAVAGDRTAQSELVGQHTERIYRFCLRMLGNEEDAMDATQETMLKVVRNLGRYDRSRPFSTWIYSIARNNCMDVFRRRGRQAELPGGELRDQGPGPLELAEMGQQWSQVQRALDSLRPAYREVLLLYHFEHLKYREIAQVLQQPMGTVMNRIFRARRELRRAYESIAREVPA